MSDLICNGTLITMEVMGCQVYTIGKANKTPFRRSGHIWYTLVLFQYQFIITVPILVLELYLVTIAVLVLGLVQ